MTAVVPAIKFCGLTREEDAREAVAQGASYLGVIFAGGRRRLEPDRARAVLADAGGTARRVGVFGAAGAEEVARVAAAAGLDVAQLHADPDAAVVQEVRARFGGEVWAVVRVAGVELPTRTRELFDVADAVVLDALAPHGLGGTGVALPWRALRDTLEALRATGGARLVLAGGLRPENVGEAVRALAPDVVDVSSGVESAPGIKDASRLRDFARAVREANGRG